jgi:hypothetical protein
VSDHVEESQNKITRIHPARPPVVPRSSPGPARPPVRVSPATRTTADPRPRGPALRYASTLLSLNAQAPARFLWFFFSCATP